MSEWWTYTLSDFLLFSPRTYYRMIERHNVAVWPGQMLTVALGLVGAVLLRRPRPWQGRVVSVILAVLWAWVAWAFLRQRYATINWAAGYLAWGFAVEAALVVWIGVIRGRLSFRARRDAAGVLGFVLFVAAIALYPLLAPLLGRGWAQAEVFGVAPDPTALGTLGLLLLAERGAGWGLMLVPVLWCLVSGATLWAMGSPEAWVLLPAACLVVGVGAWSHRAGRSSA